MSTLSSWTSHVTAEQAEQDARQRAEDDRLLLEIADARRARESRRLAKYGRVGEVGLSTDRSLASSSGSGGPSSRTGSSSARSYATTGAAERPSVNSSAAAASEPKSRRVPLPRPLSLGPTFSSSAGKENPSPPLRSASPTKSLMSPSIQLAARFFEPSTWQDVDAPPAPAREPLSPTKSNVSNAFAFAEPAPPASRKRLTHRATKSFAYVPSPARATSSASPSPPATLAKAPASRAEVQALRASPASSRPSSVAGSSRISSSSSSVARAELAALASPAKSAARPAARDFPSAASPSDWMASPSAGPLSRFRTEPSASKASGSGPVGGGTPRSIRDIIASLPVSSEPTALPSTPGTPRRTHKRAAQSFSYPLVTAAPVASYSTPSGSASGSRPTAAGSTTASASKPTVFRPALTPYSSTPSSRALASEERRPGSPSVRDIIASFPASGTGATSSPLKGMPTASSSQFRPKSHQRASKSVSYLPSTASRLGSSSNGSQLGVAPLAEIASSSTPARNDSAAARPRSPSPVPQKVIPQTAPTRATPAVAIVEQTERRGIPHSSSLTRLAGRGLVAQRVAHVPSELARHSVQERLSPGSDTSSSRLERGPSIRRQPERLALRVGSPTKRPSDAAILVESAPPSNPPEQAPDSTVQPASRYLRGPALPGLADAAAFGHTSSGRPAFNVGVHQPTTASPWNSEPSSPPVQSSAVPSRLPAAVSPRHVKLPSSPVKTSFEVVVAAPIPLSVPAAAESLPSIASAEASSPVKLTHPTRMRPKRPMAKKGRISIPPVMVSPARVPAPVAVARVTSQGRRPSGIAVPAPEDKEEPMQQVVRSPPSSWGRREGLRVGPQRDRQSSDASPQADSAQSTQMKFFVATLLAESSLAASFTRSPTKLPLSTDVFLVSEDGGVTPMALLATNAPPVLYDTELVVVVHRIRDGETKLVESKVWAWKSSQWPACVVADAKVAELGRRYGASVVTCSQWCESAELLDVFGRRLVTRQGYRAYFTPDDTALYAVRQSFGSLFIDQIDVSTSALTSRHPLILVIIGQTFLFTPTGTLTSERILARDFAALLSPDAGFTEFAPGDDAADDPASTGLFWMCFREEEAGASTVAPAIADHWRFRPTLEGSDDLRAWTIDCTNENSPATPIDTCGSTGAVFAPQAITVALCLLELFVIVGADARGRTADITFALQTAAAMATALSPNRPFLPPVHALVMPSRIPADLLVYLRDGIPRSGDVSGAAAVDEPQICMNLLSFDQALADLQTLAWPAHRLADDNFLPLGVAPSTAAVTTGAR